MTVSKPAKAPHQSPKNPPPDAAAPAPAPGASHEPSDDPTRREDWHWLQRLMDNPWLLLALGVLIPFLSYTAWGWIELLLIKPAQLP